MGEVISVAIKSFVQEPLKSVTNVATTGTGVAVAPSGLDLAVGVVGLCVSLAIGFKVYLEIRKEQLDIQIKRAELATVGRRRGDKQWVTTTHN